MSDKLQVALCLPNCSGRGIRFRVLGPTEHENLALAAAKIVGTEASMLALKRTEWSMGVRRFITEITAKDGYNTESLMAPDVKWKTPSPQEMDESYDQWFNAKDHGVLCDLFRQYHEVSLDELKSISGKVLQVSGV